MGTCVPFKAQRALQDEPQQIPRSVLDGTRYEANILESVLGRALRLVFSMRLKTGNEYVAICLRMILLS